jgi:large subunit ribosomal protein L21
LSNRARPKKIIVFKYKKRKRYRRKQGHRQTFTAVQIDSIAPMAAKTAESPQKAQAAPPETETAAAEPAAGKIEAKEAAPEKAAANKTEAGTAAEEKTATKASATQKAVPQEKDEQ